MGNPKKKKADSKRFAISQKHERNYMIKSAKRLLKLFVADLNKARREKEKSYVVLFSEEEDNEVGTRPIVRCLKVLIDILENYKRK